MELLKINWLSSPHYLYGEFSALLGIVRICQVITEAGVSQVTSVILSGTTKLEYG